MYFNIHTHILSGNENQTVNILNVDAGSDIPVNGFISVGLHPWYLTEVNAGNNFNILQSAIVQDNVLAIGECGLDKMIQTPFSLQLYWFKQQLLLAQEADLPVIVHCVRAFSEVVHAVKSLKIAVPVIFHGFNKKTELAQSLIEQGFYLSFGKSLMKSEQVANAFRTIPIKKAFLETDDQSEYSVQDMYKKAAKLLDITEDAFLLQKEQHFRETFRRFV